MKVKCVNIYNENEKKYHDTSYWLTIGKEYTILEIFIGSNNKTYYRLIGDNPDGLPNLENALQFELITGKIPSNWVVSQPNPDVIVFSPQLWLDPDFWDQCFDRDPEALKIFAKEAKIIYQEEGKKFENIWNAQNIS